MGINLKIAGRFLKSNKAQTILIALGIALGVTVQIFLGLLIKNLNNDQINQIVGNTSQITINNKENSSKIFDNYDAIIHNVKTDYPQVSEITGVLDTPGMITKGGTSNSILVRGMDYGQGQNIYDVQKDLVKGNMPTKEGQVVIGEGIAKKFDYKVGDKVTFSEPNMQTKTVEVSGIANFGVSQLNNSWLVTNLNYAQELFNEKGEVNSIEMKLYNKDIFQADTIATGISKNVNNDLTVTNWKSTNPQLLAALSGQSSSSMTIQVFIIISVAMSIAGVLAVSVMQKSKQIGILKAMGIRNSGAAAIFIYQGGILGVIGAIVGGILGIGLFEAFSNLIRTPSGAAIVTGHIYVGYLFVSMIIAIIVAILAAVFAASKSLKLDPMEVIRNN
ncbi:ABC transporter permease [uncultured Clostridium sp.]|uniref:ABC transporter permease n=1 Tax=uncultured Clostridium sp. TaxID=59620 RepID=UPI00261BF17C|nr:ABC transporter permease [uncultured Clostridium sp.]